MKGYSKYYSHTSNFDGPPAGAKCSKPKSYDNYAVKKWHSGVLYSLKPPEI